MNQKDINEAIEALTVNELRKYLNAVKKIAEVKHVLGLYLCVVDPSHQILATRKIGQFSSKEESDLAFKQAVFKTQLLSEQEELICSRQIPIDNRTEDYGAIKIKGYTVGCHGLKNSKQNELFTYLVLMRVFINQAYLFGEGAQMRPIMDSIGDTLQDNELIESYIRQISPSQEDEEISEKGTTSTN